MRETHHDRKARRWPRRVLPAGILLALAAVAGVPGVALARFSSQPPAQTASVTAATIGAPTNLTATTTGSTTATLSWTAPSTLTGYTLSQSPGTLGGCSAAPSASTTSCTATGLSPKTAYTWTLTATYDNWKGSSVQASSTTFAAVAATLLGKATDSTSGSQSTSVSGVSTTSGATLLILAYRQGTSGNLAISSITGSAISGTPASITSEPFNGTGGGKFAVIAWRATGSGTSNGTVTVSFSAANNVSTTIDVVQLSGNNTSTPVAGSAVSTNTGTAVTGGSLSPGNPNDGEVFFAGLTTSTTMSAPTGYTALDVPATTVHGSWFSSSASSPGATANLGASSTWGSVEIEINHG
jgi:trimeric autotransporter adhesin